MVPPEADSYLVELTARVSRVLAGDLVGLYVHGSAAMGGWNVRQSDVDVLVVVARRLSKEEKAVLARNMQSLEPPGAGLECSVVRSPLRTQPGERPPFELHLTTGADPKVVDGEGHPGDSDLVMHYAVCRERGVAVAGPPPVSVFPEVARAMLLRAFRDELRWGLEHAPAHYAVLNACRAWAYAEESKIFSKLEGADWALSRNVEPALVAAALTVQSGAPATLEAGDVKDLVDAATEALNREIVGGN